jgi:iron complex outermembrane receptor protein
MSTMLRLLFFAGIATLASAQRVGAPTDDLDKLKLDELFAVQVVSVGRKAQQLAKAPGAVFVLNAEDIRRSGATSIPEALQWVPGLTVLHLDGRSWIVSARGGARLYSDKMLVMVDGRPLYTPLFSGVIWDAIDVPLEEIERIEVVRGPGAVMWGPNAVNGVIQIITRRAKTTKGGQVKASTGNELRGELSARWGGAAGEKIAYRFWGKLESRSPAYHSPGLYYLLGNFPYSADRIDNLDFANGRTGFRLDGEPNEKNRWTVQGDIFKTGRQDAMVYPILLPDLLFKTQQHTAYDGGSIQARWTHSRSAGEESTIQFSYDKTKLNYPYSGGILNNFTADFENRRQTGERNEIYWGAGYQQYWDGMRREGVISFQPPNSVYRIGDAVIRDEFQLIPGRLLLSAGVRVDYNDYKDLEYQPSIRLLYTPSSKQSSWLALSRAVRAPSRFDRDIVEDAGKQLFDGYPVHLTLTGNPYVRSEVEKSIEFGYRRQSGQHWSIDASLFLSFYDRLRLLESPALPQIVFEGSSVGLVAAAIVGNGGRGRSYGGEIWTTWQVRSRWRLIPSYSYLDEARWPPAADGALRYIWDGTPARLAHQALVRSQFDVSRTVQLDLQARAKSKEQAFQLPGMVLVDARLGWRPVRTMELSLSVRNLMNRKNIECYPEVMVAAIPLRRTFVWALTERF